MGSFSFSVVPQVGGGPPPFIFDVLLFQLLAKLLKSKNPDDLQEANKLIKSMVKEVSRPGSLGVGRGPCDHSTKVPQYVRSVSFLLPPALTWREWKDEAL